MADQRITELVELSQGGVSSNDVLPIADVSASQTKKVQVKSLIQAGFNLADASTLDISKINQASAAKLGAAAIGTNVLTYDKIQQVSATDRLLGRSSAGAGNIEEIICTSFARSLLDDADATTARSTLSLGVVATGNTINTSLIEDLAITTGKINNDAVTTAKIADANITTAKIANGAVDSAQLAASGVVQGKLATNSVITVNIVDSGVTQAKLAANAVGTVNIISSGVTQSKLAADAVSTVNITDSAVTLAKMASGSVGTAQLIGSGITQEKLAADAVATINIIASGITQAKLAANAVATVNVVDSGITQAKLASASIDTVNIINGAVTLAKMASGSVDTAQLVASGITQSKLAANAVGTVNVVDSGITQQKLAANAVATINIADSGITQAKLGSSSVDTINIIDAAVTLAKMATGSVNTAQLIASGVTQEKLSANAVATINLVDSGVTQSKLAANSVTTINLIDSGVTNSKLASGSVTIGKLNIASGELSGTVITASSILPGSYTAGSITTSDLADNAVTFAKIQQVASGVLLGRASAGSGNVETITLTAAGRALLDDNDASAQRATLGLGTLAIQNTVGSGDYDAASIVSVDIADSAIITSKLADSGVTTIKIADGNITIDKLASNSVSTAKLVDSGVTTVKIVDSGITQAKLAANAVATINLVDSGVTTAKIASGAVTIGKLSLSSGELTGSVITASSIPSGSYANGSIITADIADNAITFAKIQQVASGVLLGRASAGSGNVETIALTEAGRALLNDADATAQRTTLGLGSMAIQAASGVLITGGTAVLSSGTISYATINGGVISGITDLAIADGGTGASTASGARTNLGLAIGTDVQAYDAALASIAGLTTASGQIIYTTASDTYTTTTITAAGRAILDDADASAQRVTLGLGSLAVKNTVGSGDYDSSSIVTANIADFAITTAKITDSGITTIKIADANVTQAKLASGSVSTTKIVDSGVTTAKLADNAVSYAKIQATTASDVILGRSSASGGTIEEITCTSAARSILDDASIADIRTTLGLGTLATQNGTFSGTSTGTNTGDQTITLSGDVTGTGTGAFATTISNNAVTTVKILDGAITTTKIVDSGVTAAKLADDSAAIVAGSTPAGDGDFVGQQWLNTNTGIEYTWTGSAWLRQSGLSTAVISGDTIYSFTTSYPDSFSASIVPSLNTQVATRFFAGPASGSADAAPTFRAISASDLPKATTTELGVAQAGTGLVTVSGIFNHANNVASGTYYKVSVDAQGHITTGETSLVSDDIPSLPASKITTGTFGSGFIADESIIASKLANYSVSQFGEAPPIADFIGQFFFNPLEKDLYLWDGNVWNPVGISVGEIIFGGTYNASGNTIASVSADGAGIGLSVGQPLPAASTTFNRYYVVVASGGTGTSPAPETILQPPDILLCNGTAWVELDVSSTYLSQAASNVAFSPAGTIGSTNVQSAIEEVNTECRNLNNVASGILATGYGGTGANSYTRGDILVGSGTTLIKQAVGTNGQVLTANSAFGGGVHWTTPTVGTVTLVSVNSPLTVVSGSTTPIISIPDASTSVRGSVQLTDSTSTTSSSLAATATAVKSAFDLANAALPRAGGTITGEVVIGNTGTLLFEGAIDNAFEIQLTAADATSDKVVTLPDTTGTVITTGDTGTVTNAMLAGSIADTKLSTISTAGKVSNSATTATSANTVSAIVARDSSGNFSAGTIDATIDEGTF